MTIFLVLACFGGHFPLPLSVNVVTFIIPLSILYFLGLPGNLSIQLCISVLENSFSKKFISFGSSLFAKKPVSVFTGTQNEKV